jgi:hypothetical protein
MPAFVALVLIYLLISALLAPSLGRFLSHAEGTGFSTLTKIPNRSAEMASESQVLQTEVQLWLTAP